jgi:hypothetical protein
MDSPRHGDIMMPVAVERRREGIWANQSISDGEEAVGVRA